MSRASFDFLLDGGKAGEEIRNFNWNNTSLGSPEGWPEPLKVTLRLVLNSAVPMQILWGKDFIHFYNDLYFPILESMGKKSLIGLSGQQAFAEVWDNVGFMLEDTLEGKPVFQKDFCLNFQKEGEIVKCYFDFSYTPIKLYDGSVGGVFVNVNETTEKVLAIKEIVDSNEKFQFALNAAELGSFEYDLVNKYFFLSERARQIFGFEKDTIIKPKDVFNCLQIEEEEIIRNTFKALKDFAGKNKFDLKLAIGKCQSNAEVIVKAFGMLLYDLAGKPIKFSGTLQDITTEENNRKALIDREQNLQDLFKKAPVAFCLLKGSDFIVEMANDKMLELIKRDSSELINKPADSTFSPSVIKQLIPALQSVYLTGNSFIGNEYPLKVTRNETVELAYVNFIAQYQKGFERIIVVATDVTDQVLYRKNIEENERLFHEMANSLIQKVWSIDKDENIIFLSDRWEEYSGTKHSKDYFINMVHPLDIPQSYTDWELAKSSKSPFSSVIRLKNKFGEYRWHEGYANPTFNIDGEVEKWIGTYSDIHEKKLAEESLKLQSLVLESMDEGVCVWDENGYILFTNHTQNEMFGFKDGELLGKHVSLLGSKTVDGNALDNIFSLIEEKGFWTGRFASQAKCGKEFITQAQVNSIDLNGKKMLVSVQRNITDELKRNAELSRFKYMVDNFTDPVILVKEDGKFAYLNNMALKHWHYTEEDAKKLTIFDIFPGYSVKKFDTAFELAQHSELSHFELNIAIGQGTIHPVELSMSGLMLEGVPYLFAAIRDITERKKTEMRLALSLKQFREMAETMPQFVWTADESGTLNYFNKAVFEYSGLTEKELLGDGYLKMVHEQDQELNIEKWTNSVEKGEPFMLEHRFRRSDGEYRWMLSRAVSQKNKDGEIELWVGTSTDIHDRKLKADILEESVESRTIELKKVNARLKQSNSELEQFAYVASHDLQEPLRKIKTFASLMVEGSMNYSESENNYLQKIISSSERMTVLINDVLNFAKLTHDEKTFSEVDLNEIIDNVKMDLELQIKAKNVLINSDVLPVINAIPIQMNQLFFNLMSNSLKFGKPDEQLKIDIKFRDLSSEEVKDITGINEKNKFFEINFTDNGIGFNQIYADKIFNIFQRLNNRSFSGSGIGLALCRRIVIYQGGAIYATGKENEGAEFHIVLPYKNVKTED